MRLRYEGWLHDVRMRIDRHAEEGTVPASVLLEPLRELPLQEIEERGFDELAEAVVDHLHWRLRYAVRRHYDAFRGEGAAETGPFLRRLKEAERFMERAVQEILALGPEGEEMLRHETVAYAQRICAHFKTLTRTYADLMEDGASAPSDDENREGRVEA